MRYTLNSLPSAAPASLFPDWREGAVRVSCYDRNFFLQRRHEIALLSWSAQNGHQNCWGSPVHGVSCLYIYLFSCPSKFPSGTFCNDFLCSKLYFSTTLFVVNKHIITYSMKVFLKVFLRQLKFVCFTKNLIPMKIFIVIQIYLRTRTNI